MEMHVKVVDSKNKFDDYYFNNLTKSKKLETKNFFLSMSKTMSI